MTDDTVGGAARPTPTPSTRRRGIRGIDWGHMLAEGLLIVGSVYLAIYLQRVSDERERVEDARTALALLRQELEQDRRDLAEIVAEQTMLSDRYEDLGRWLANPSAMPSDSVQAALRVLAYTNRTMFPRKGAWTTMLAEGYLGALDDPELSARLGTFYGRIYDRLEYNGRYYDESLLEILRESMPAAWDFVRVEPSGNRERLRLLRDQLSFMHETWNRFYIGLLGEYEQELNGAIEEVDAYLSD